MFVDLKDLDKDEANFARSERKIEHAGVAAHPGDKGHAGDRRRDLAGHRETIVRCELAGVPRTDSRTDMPTRSALPLTWSETENVVWKTPIHDHGWSSPVVWQNQIWVTTATEDGTQLFAVCVDRDTGKILHDVKVFDVEKPEHVAAVNSLRVTDSGHRGRARLRPLRHVRYGLPGHGIGPGVVDAARFELRPPRGPWIVADPVRRPVDRPRGRSRRAVRHRPGQGDRQDRLEDQPLDRLQPVLGQHAQGVLHTHGDRHGHTQGTDQSRGQRQSWATIPQTGEELWKIRHDGWSMVPRPIFGHGLVFFVNDFERPELWAIRPGGSG